jgi:hypothetical protein
MTRLNVPSSISSSWTADYARPGRSVSCPSPDHGGEDRNPSCHVMADDRRVLCFKPGCGFENGGRGRDAWDLAQLAPGARRSVA